MHMFPCNGFGSGFMTPAGHSDVIRWARHPQEVLPPGGFLCCLERLKPSHLMGSFLKQRFSHPVPWSLVRSSQLSQFLFMDPLRKSTPSDNLAPNFTWCSWTSPAHKVQRLIYIQTLLWGSESLFPPNQNNSVVLEIGLCTCCTRSEVWAEQHHIQLAPPCSVLWCWSSKACVPSNTQTWHFEMPQGMQHIAEG